MPRSEENFLSTLHIMIALKAWFALGKTLRPGCEGVVLAIGTALRSLASLNPLIQGLEG